MSDTCLNNTTSPKPRKPDKRTVEQDLFDGFSWDILDEGYSQLPNTWIKLVAVIQNLSELKVVLYVLRHTWGFQEYNTPKHITTDEFVHGRKRKDKTRMDIGTGLSERAVINGLALAEKHGFIVCEVDDSDPGRVKKSYKLKMQPVVQDDLHTVQPDLKIVHTWNEECADRSKNKLENEPSEQTEEIRMVHPSKNHETELRYIPQNIKYFITDFVYDLGDDTGNLRSNMTRANRLYQNSGMPLDDFLDAMYEARRIAKKTAIKKKNKEGKINRMPYFFTCLETATQPIAERG
jgi:predicted transcriptional regulator